MTAELKNFGARLAIVGRGETELAISLIWYLCHVEGATEAPVAEVAKLLHDLALSGRVNVSRLTTRLGKNRGVVRGSKAGTFKIRLSDLDRLTVEHEPLLERPMPNVSNHVVDKGEFVGARKYVLTLIEQINGNYQFRFYDGCAVMCRRLMETLLIESFECQGHGDKIKTADGEYVGLADIIARARGGQNIKLQRGSADVMEKIKKLGDTAAHSRMYITKQTDIDRVQFDYGKVISELGHLARIT